MALAAPDPGAIMRYIHLARPIPQCTVTPLLLLTALLRCHMEDGPVGRVAPAHGLGSSAGRNTGSTTSALCSMRAFGPSGDQTQPLAFSPIFKFETRARVRSPIAQHWIV